MRKGRQEVEEGWRKNDEEMKEKEGGGNEADGRKRMVGRLVMG